MFYTIGDKYKDEKFLNDDQSKNNLKDRKIF